MQAEQGQYGHDHHDQADQINNAAHSDLRFLRIVNCKRRYPGKALRGFERDRRARTAKVQKFARKQGRLYGMVGPEAFARNVIMRMMGGKKLLARYDWLYSWRPPSFEPDPTKIVQLGGEDTQES
jgi:hypothetical protein